MSQQDTGGSFIFS